MFTENKDFYPTPLNTYVKLVSGLYLNHNSLVLEPSCGKGDMVDYLKEKDSVRNIDCIENDPNLVNLLFQKGITTIWDDFLTFNTSKEYDAIIMNPPFSNGVDHLLHAIRMCENNILRDTKIACILNANTIKNDFSNKRTKLNSLLEKYNANIEYYTDEFKNAERKTNVEVAIIKVTVTREITGKRILDSVFETLNNTQKVKTKEQLELETGLSTFVKSNELANKLNDIERYVLQYEKSIELLKNKYQAMELYNEFTSEFVNENKSETYEHIYGQHTNPLDDFDKEFYTLKSYFWDKILNTKEFLDKLTNSSRQEVQIRLSSMKSLEINLTNIKMLLTAVSQNEQNMLKEACIDMFKSITKYSYREFSKNIHYYDGWKTNESYKVNKKVVIPLKYSAFDDWDMGNRRGELSYDYVTYEIKNFVEDLNKMFSILKPNLNTEFTTNGIGDFENELFRFKMFKKGTVHFWFKDDVLLNKFNFICGQEFNWLPTDEELKESKDAREFVMKEFGDNILKLTV